VSKSFDPKMSLVLVQEAAAGAACGAAGALPKSLPNKSSDGCC